MLYARDRTETTARVWMGLTANCAVCHDHKFDPLPQKEFYSLSAFFNNTTQAAMDGNIKDTPPVMFVAGTPEDRKRGKTIDGQIAEIKKQINDRKQSARADFEKWVAGPAKQSLAAKASGDGLRFHAPLSEGQGRSVAITVDAKPRTLALAADAAWSAGEVAAKAFMAQDKTPLEIAEAGDLDSQQAFSYGGWVKIPGKVGGGALLARMDDGNAFRGWDMWLEDDRPGAHLINHWPDNAIKVVSRTPIQPGKWQHVMVTYDGSRRASGTRVYIDGKPQAVDVQSDSLKDTMRTKVPLKIAQRHSASRINGVALQDLRIYGRNLSEGEVEQLASSSRLASILEKPAAQSEQGRER